MDKRELWSPGIFGFIILLAEFLLANDGHDIQDFFGLALLTTPVVAIFCMGALIKAFRPLKGQEGEDTRPDSLRFIDTVLGFVGILVLIYSVFGYTPRHETDVQVIQVILVVVVPLWGGIGYVLFSKRHHCKTVKSSIMAVNWFLLSGISCLLIAVVLSLRYPEAGSSNRDAVLNDLGNLAATAYQYRIRPASMGGGAGSYAGFVMPSKMQSNDNATYACTALANEVTFSAISAENMANTVMARIDSEGHFIPEAWKFSGDFDPSPPEFLSRYR